MNQWRKKVDINLQPVKELGNHPVIAKPRAAYARHRYSTPLFILRETLSGFQLHNGFGISASLSFYAMFALIPMALLIFFMLSHLILSSNYAIVKLAILTSNLVPKFSHRIMIEVYNATRHQAAWGVFGLMMMFWVVTPLAGALRSAFHTIAASLEERSFLRKKIQDIVAVLAILFLFFIFTFMGLVLEKTIHFFAPSAKYAQSITAVATIAISTLLIAVFYRVFFPARIAFRNILIGSVVTGLMWIAMRPAFSLFLSVNQSFGSVFGGMKSMFISIGWLYYTFAVFLIGTELISTLHKKDVLLLKALFSELPEDREIYLNELMSRYGHTYMKGDYIFKHGDEGLDLYYIVSGDVQLRYPGMDSRNLQAGDYFGEMALLTESPRIADAIVISEEADIIIVSSANIETLLLGEPKVAMRFLKRMASSLQHSHRKPAFNAQANE